MPSGNFAARTWMTCTAAVAISGAISLSTLLAGDAPPAPPGRNTPTKAEPARLDTTAAALEIQKGDAPTPPDKTAATPVSGTKPAETTGPVLLRYKYDVNQVTYYDVLHTMRITTQKNQSSETAQNESHAVKHYRVVAVEPDGSALLELVIDRVRMSAQFGENDPVTFDSEKSEVCPPQFEKVRESVGKPLARVKVTPTGELVNVVRTAVPNAPAAGETPDNDPSNNFLVPLPKNPLKVGESWSDQIEVKVTVAKGLTRNVAILRRYDLKSVSGNVATIDTVSTVVTPVKDPAINGQLIQRTPSGTIVFDMEAGRIVSYELKTDKTEVGVFEENSSMRAVSSRVEKLVTRDEALRTAKETNGKTTTN